MTGKNCTHAYLYENPNWENLKCMDCDAEVEPEED